MGLQLLGGAVEAVMPQLLANLFCFVGRALLHNGACVFSSPAWGDLKPRGQ